MPDWWTLKLDWDRNGNYTGTYDNVTSRVKEGYPVKWSIGLRAYNRVCDETVLTFTLDNYDRLYSPWYASGALYGKIVPNLPVQLAFGSTAHFTGLTRKFTPTINRYGEQICSVETVTTKEQLSKIPAFTELFQNTTVDRILATILTEYAVPATCGKWILDDPDLSELGVTTVLAAESDVFVGDTGLATVNYAGDNISEGNRPASVWDMLVDLVWLEGGQLWIDRAGVYRFKNRNAWTGLTTAELTIDNTGKSIAIPDYVAPNSVQLTCFPRIESADNEQNIYTMTQATTVPANDSVTLRCLYSDGTKNVGATDVQDATVDAGTASIVPFAQNAEVTITNSEAAAITVTSLTIKGKTITTDYGLVITAEDDTTIGELAQRAFTMTIKSLDNPDYALDRALHELQVQSKLSDQNVNSITVSSGEGGDATQRGITVGDVITIQDYQTALDVTMIVVKEDQTYDIGTRYLTSTWFLQPVAVFWVLGVAGFTELGDTTYLAV